jgi:phospholipase/carboxylesterase
MMALHVAPRRAAPFGGIVAFSGRLLKPESLTEEALSTPPILLVHGDADEVVPVQSLPEAAEALEQAGFERVYAHIMKGTGHGIAPDGLQGSGPFLIRGCSPKKPSHSRSIATPDLEACLGFVPRYSPP